MIESVRRHPWRVIAVLTATSVVSLSLFVIQALGATGSPTKTVSSRVDKASGVDANVKVCTTSTTYVDMPDMSRTFTVEGSTNRKAVVMFQAEVDNTLPGTLTIVQLLVDGNPPTGMDFAVLLDGAGQETHGTNFITDSLDPGSHTAKIRWRTSAGVEVCVDNRSMVVLFDGS